MSDLDKICGTPGWLKHVPRNEMFAVAESNVVFPINQLARAFSRRHVHVIHRDPITILRFISELRIEISRASHRNCWRFSERKRAGSVRFRTTRRKEGETRKHLSVATCLSFWGNFSADDAKRWRNTRSGLMTPAYLALTLVSAIETRPFVHMYVRTHPSLVHSAACHDRDFPRISPSESSRTRRTRRRSAHRDEFASLGKDATEKEIGLIARIVLTCSRMPNVNDFSLEA